MTEPGERIRHFKDDGSISENRLRRPFHSFDEKFADVLVRDFAIPALRWLHGHSVGVAPSTLVSAHAEVALTISATIGLGRKRPDLLGGPFDDLMVKCAEEVAWLVKQATFHEDGTCCFDHSSWDTSTAVRALFDVIHFDPIMDLVHDKDLDAFDRVIVGGARWLLSRFNDADLGDLGSLLNPSEYAQIGRALATVEERYNIDAEVRLHTRYVNISEVVSRILMTLIERKSERKFEINTDDGSITQVSIWWDDFFGTSEVLLFFGTLNEAAERGSITLPAVERRLLRECIARCFLLLEHSQSDGLWGGYLDTVGVLNAYISVTEQSKRLFNKGRDHRLLLAQPRIVFRALRWMCDPTQRSSDGSVLHTAWLTTLFAITVVQAAVAWSYADKTVGDLYDDLSMAMDRGVSEFRARQIAAVLDRELALEKLGDTAAKLDRQTKRLEHLRWVRSRIILTVLVLFGFLTVTFSGGVLGNIFSVTLHATNAADVLSLTALSSASALAIVTVLWSVGRPPS